ncbi:MAG: hypothetical protein ACKV22_10660 [Bryobacteraceae bacterium]
MSLSNRILPIVACLTLLSAAAQAQTITVASGNGQVVRPNFITDPLIVEVRSSQGVPAQGVEVRWQIASGQLGTLTNSVTFTDASGRTSATFVGGNVFNTSSFAQTQVTASLAANPSAAAIFTVTTVNFDQASGSLTIDTLLLSPDLTQLPVEGGSGSTGNVPVRVSVIATRGFSPGPVPHVSVRVEEQPGATGTLRCKEGTVYTDATGVAQCTLLFGGNAGFGRFSVFVGGNFLTFIDKAFEVTALYRFVPVTPCRVMDTRGGQGTAGAFGPPALTAGFTRTIPVPASRCGIPADARAYSLNTTVVPRGSLGYLTVWPEGQPQPLVSTLNSFQGEIVANAAIVPAGVNGAISVFVTDTTDAIIDINGYFALPEAGGLQFFPLTPCRVADSRLGSGKSGAFGAPRLLSGGIRDLPIPSSGCGAPASAKAYSVNLTVVPPGLLAYVTLWPSGQPQPFVSTLNSFAGAVVANAAIVPAGTGGAIRIYASDPTDFILDINGYFAAPGTGGLNFAPVAPCRIADTRAGSGFTGAFGAPTPASGSTRTLPVPSSGCGLPANARAYSFNVTVVPSSPLAYLTTWPAGLLRPLVSTLNSFRGYVVANAAIVPAGTDGAVNFYVTDPTNLVVDVNGYFVH